MLVLLVLFLFLFYFDLNSVKHACQLKLLALRCVLLLAGGWRENASNQALAKAMIARPARKKKQNWDVLANILQRAHLRRENGLVAAAGGMKGLHRGGKTQNLSARKHITTPVRHGLCCRNTVVRHKGQNRRCVSFFAGFAKMNRT